MLINAYVSDPAHIVPSRSDSNSNGHFPPTNGGQPTGTPRGFSLQNYAVNPANFPFAMPIFGNMMAAMGANGPGWHAPGAGSDDRATGPIRRGGGAMGGGARYNNRPGPYDRRGGGPGQRYDALGGGGMGGRGGRPAPPGAGRWGDGAAGGAAMGPREAVQGRTIKSYEDLDQVSGGGSGELNY